MGSSLWAMTLFPVQQVQVLSVTPSLHQEALVEFCWAEQWWWKFRSVTLGRNASLSSQRDANGFLCGESSIIASGSSLVYSEFTTYGLSRAKLPTESNSYRMRELPVRSQVSFLASVLPGFSPLYSEISKSSTIKTRKYPCRVPVKREPSCHPGDKGGILFFLLNSSSTYLLLKST